jgi:flagellar hook-length control protein FliK
MSQNGIDLAPSTGGMMVSGISGNPEILPDEANQRAPIGHTGAEGSEFAALLLLMAAAPMLHRLSAAAAGPVPGGVSEERSVNSDISRSAGVVATDDVQITPLAGETPAQQNAASEILLEPSKGSALISEIQLSRSIPLAPEHGARLEDFPSRESGFDDHRVTGSVTKDPWRWADQSPALLHSFNASATVDADEAGPSESSLVSQTALTAVDAPKIHAAAAKISDRALDTTASLDTDHRADLFQPLTNDQHAPVPVVEHNRSAVDGDRGKIPHHSVPLNRTEPLHLAETGLKFLEQSQLHSEGEPNRPVVPWSSAIVDKVRPMHAQNGKQEFSDQQNARRGETFPTLTETEIESAWRDAVPFQLTHTVDKVPVTSERESQHLDWRPIIDRVAGEISGRIHIGKQQAVLQLDPPDLGRVRIDIQMEGDKLAARIRTETQESRTLIEAHLPELRQALVENQVELVDVRIDSGGWSGSRSDSQQAQQESGDRRQTAHAFSDLKADHAEKRESARLAPLALEPGRVSMWA